jgi:threonylcarbamoyladenosine tRNA methylthiotransferase MtaB
MNGRLRVQEAIIGTIPMKRFVIKTLGCRTNQYESQAYRDQLKAQGYEEAQEGETADLCIVNTCTVTQSADRRSRATVRQLRREQPGATLAVTGCMVERPDQKEQLQGVDHWVGNRNKDQLLQLVRPEEEWPEFSIRHFEAHTRAFVKVQDGCNSFCSYCVIPYVRGRSRSRSIEEAVAEVEGLVASGYREVVLTGINVGDFEGGLAQLVRAVDQVEGLERLRISSIDPDEVDESLLEAVLMGKATCHSLHMVLQAGSNVVLKRMRRKYTRQMFQEAVDRVRTADPDFTFTTDVIVGFPGETEADFEETLELVEQVQFAKVHCFPYSVREGTLAARYPNQVPPSQIRQRQTRLLHAAQQAGYRLRERFVGRRMELLTESEGMGHTANFLPVRIEERLPPNQLVQVELVGNEPDQLIGRCA